MLLNERVIVSTLVLLLGTIAFACCIAAEFKKFKAKDIQLDGSLCSIPRSAAFGLGIAALVCISIAQVVGTSMAATRLGRVQTRDHSGRNKILPIALIVLSWVSFGTAAILLGAASSMNGGQPYGKGWLDGECYVVKTGVYIGAAVLILATSAFILGLIFSTMTSAAVIPHLTCSDTENISDQQPK